MTEYQTEFKNAPVGSLIYIFCNKKIYRI